MSVRPQQGDNVHREGGGESRHNMIRKAQEGGKFSSLGGGKLQINARW